MNYLINIGWLFFLSFVSVSGVYDVDFRVNEKETYYFFLVQDSLISSTEYPIREEVIKVEKRGNILHLLTYRIVCNSLGTWNIMILRVTSTILINSDV